MEKETHVGKLEAQLKQWGARLDAFVAKADEVGAEAKADYHKSIDDLKAKFQAAQAKLEELRASGGETWEGFKAGVDTAWTELESALKKLTH